MKTDEQIRKAVMRRVRLMYYARQAAKPAPRVALLGALSAGLVSTVSVVNVALNAFMVGGVSQFITFAAVAFAGTTFAAQALTLALVATIGWFVFDALKKIQSVVLPARAAATAQ
jgi:hypothetical protein